MRIKVVVELRVQKVRDDMQLRVDSGCGGAGVSRRDTGHGLTVTSQIPFAQDQDADRR